MSLTNLVRSALFGAAVTLGCAAPKPEPEISVEVLQATSDRSGFVDFPGTEQDIYIKDAAENYLDGAQTTVYKISRDGQYAGDVYTAQAGEQGGINVYLHPSNQGAYLLSDRYVITYAPDQPPSFGRDYRQLTLDLLRWIGRGEYTCDGIFTTAQLRDGQGRSEDIFELITFLNADGDFNSIYNRMGNLRERGVLRGLPAGKQWAVLTPNHPRATPETFQLDLARQIYSPEAYQRIIDSCSVPAEPCADVPGLLFCDDFSGRELDTGKWSNDCGRDGQILSISNGILRLASSSADSGCGLDSISKYPLGDSTLILEARWKSSGSTTQFFIGLVPAIDVGRIYFITYDSGRWFCGYDLSPGFGRHIECCHDSTAYVTTKFVVRGSEIRYFVNGSFVTTVTDYEPFRNPYGAAIFCEGGTPEQPVCFLDYVKLMRE